MTVTQQSPERERPHPNTKTYVKVALFLGVITGVEILLSYIDLNIWVLIVSLVALALIKFATVVMYFMHLKFDHPALRKPFITGMVLAMAVYTIVLVNMVYHHAGAVSD